MENALPALEWTGVVGILRDDDLIHAARLTSEDAAAVIERRTDGDRRFVYMGPRLDLPLGEPVEYTIIIDQPGVRALEFSQRSHALAYFLRATAGANGLLSLLARRAPETRHLRRWLASVIHELDGSRPMVAGWFAATAAGCLFGALDDGEPGWRYIEVGLEP
jgi:hypothetical protein